MTLFEACRRCCIKDNQLPDEWDIGSISLCESDAPRGFAKVVGAVFAKYLLGKQKGKPNYNKPISEVETFFVSLESAHKLIKDTQ